MPHKNIPILLKLFIAGSGFLCAPQLQADEYPKPFAAQYAGSEKVAVFTVKATLDLQLTRSGDYIKYVSNSLLKWSFYERRFYDCSVMSIKDGKLRPLEYLHIDDGDPDNEIDTKFDWSAGKVITHRPDKDKPREYDISWPTWDPMSLQVAMMSLAPTAEKGETQKHTSIENGKWRDYEVTFNGDVTTKTKIPDIRVAEVITKREDETGGLWLAPDYGWIPAKIKIDEVIIDLQKPPVFDDSDWQNNNGNKIPSCEMK